MSSIFGENKAGAEGTAEEVVLRQQQNLVISTGIPGFDDSLGQGLPGGNLYLISGSVGSSATQFAQQILYHSLVSKGKIAYYTVENPSTDVIQEMSILGMNIQQYVDDGSWTFVRIVPPNMKKIMDVLPEVPMELRLDLDETLTKLMNHFYDSVKEGRSTALQLPQLVRNYPLEEIQNLLFYMKGIIRRYGGIHFMFITEGAHEQNIMITIKDVADSVFEISTAERGTEIENIITISKIRNMMPKARVVRLAQREGGLATETIRRVQ